ncbi:hypothetical protein A1Q2_00933 [Trichosporon asahii var. asahii CBS 8904]|uniref:Uncharacterized protein n=2 Tax=Trichosporon asahii var. asahii TaxID=189963 RepID=K1W751_TRIAC|nr:hypothetical protein A1Q1_05874 [Trichosporon asahii var. asahii CBS 2479]EJT45725.1 hypothetical protein A1Q1_05874 [Trichosporon asahii var. asahii CBS 2479]EKD04703.1 hypothetical protein A1Q2_00933 [Trichosporon asahii var. asahii CBS 8904]
MLVFLLAAPLLALPAAAITTNEGSVCLDSCASWSTTLEHCRNTFSDKRLLLLEPVPRLSLHGPEPERRVREHDDKPVGEQLRVVLDDASAHQEGPLRADNQTFINLCAVQAQNGSAANSTFFAPVSYKTGDDQEIKDSLEKHSAALPLVWSGALLTAALGAALSAL